ncbi:MAG: choice-of-anchor T family protein [Thermoplasmata archaeon]
MRHIKTDIKKLISIPIIIILILSIVVLSIPEKTSAGFVYSVEVQAVNGTAYADVGPGQPAFATLSFKVTNNGYNVNEKIAMSVSFGAGALSATVSPSQFSLSYGTSQMVTAYVSVDRNAEAPRSIPIDVTATVTNSPSSARAAASGTVIVRQFSFIDIKPVGGLNYSLESGSSKTIVISLVNEGNGEDAITFEVANRGELIVKGWEIPGAEDFRIATKKMENVSLVIKAPDTTKSEDVKITLRATTTLKNVSSYSPDVNLTATVKAKSGNATPGISTPAIIAALLIGLLISRRKGWPSKLWTKKSG